MFRYVIESRKVRLKVRNFQKQEFSGCKIFFSQVEFFSKFFYGRRQNADFNYFDNFGASMRGVRITNVTDFSLKFHAKFTETLLTEDFCYVIWEISWKNHDNFWRLPENLWKKSERKPALNVNFATKFLNPTRFDWDAKSVMNNEKNLNENEGFA